MKKLIWLAALVSAGSLLAHHSLTNYDTTKAVRVKGTIVAFQAINPHSFVFIEEKGSDGQMHRWAIEGPSVLQLQRTNFPQDVLKSGSVVEACGYAPKEPIMWQIANPAPGGVSLAGRLLNGEMMILADGKQLSWGDYGFHHCFESGYRDQHSK